MANALKLFVVTVVAFVALTAVAGSQVVVTPSPTQLPFANIAQGTITVNTQPALNITTTWNAGAVTFTAIKLNVTNTASAGGSLLADFQVGGTQKAYIASTGTIGTVASLYATSGIFTAPGGHIYWESRSIMDSPADGVILFKNAAGTDFSRLQFGGTTSSFPALKRSAAALQARLADDSAFSTFGAGVLGVGTAQSTISSPSDGVIALGNAAMTDFGRLQFGGTTSSYPSIARNAATIDFMLADTSNYANVQGRKFTSYVNAIGTTTNPGMSIENVTAAAAGAQQYSPGLSFIGQGWKTDATAASQPVEMRFEMRPVQGAANPSGLFTLMSRINSGAWTDLFSWSTTGAHYVGNGLIDITKSSIGSTTTAGLILQNTTAAGAGAQQYAPSLTLIGRGWKTDATAGSQTVEGRIELRPVQGAAAPTMNYVFMSRVDGGAWSDDLWLQSISSNYLTMPQYGIFQVDGFVNVGGTASGVALITNSSGTTLTTLQLGSTTYGPNMGLHTKKVTGIADNSATAVWTVTVPNANHAAAIETTFVCSNGSTDAFESTRVAVGMVVLTRTTGVNTVATAVALRDAGIATVAAGATHTLAYAVSSMTGGSGAQQTFTINVTVDDSGNLGSNQCVSTARIINAQDTGVTIA